MAGFTITFEQGIALAGLFLTGIIMLGGVAAWLMSRQDRRDGAFEKEIERVKLTLTRAHQRLDELPATYIQRQEVMGHFSRIETGQSEMRSEFNQRLDRLIQMISGAKER